MGAAMAARLLKAGHPVTVWNRTAAKAQALAEHGATVAGSITELAERDIVFVMVSTPRDLEEVVLGTRRRPSPPSCSARTSTSGWRRPASTR
jgi:3-hydroxyisobutyrate dehydrogenase-like beta-hydroxyacid dehydrogenase